ncbi:FMN-linked oxidoreductase [Dacryopinax primogenitus]|uniref:FMN-linked oxidoreductase n=1 Tax=Dacryopinax primogenitus (strain DJM 731) TaxID=1858805 RepID=M5G0L7_DACPD|nr:FMN-linked oxidoreductase [Dacryopinax primogenitus]EJU02284.1 FMN-linked oxidoreductase [Dacryopinax primogenitus]
MTTNPNKREEELSAAEVLRQPITLPCGKIIPNRLVQASMYEALATFGGGLPNNIHFRLYEAWSHGGWGMILCGAALCSTEHVSLGQDLIMLPRTKLDSYSRLAKSIKGPQPGPSSPLAFMQLNHPGRQSMRGNFRPPWSPALAPSAIPMDSEEGWLATLAYRTFYGIPREMTVEDIERVVRQFTDASVMAYETGWDGVELHCAHGYLLSTFLSPRTNHRKDAYGGSTRARTKILLDIISSIRATVPSSFALGIKLNSRDMTKGGLTEEEALEQVRLIHEHGGVDFIEISGGTYEAVAFMESSDSTAKPFFERFAMAASSLLANDPNAPRIILTGNMRSRVQCAEVVKHNTAQLCGMGRPAAMDPAFAAKLLDDRVPDAKAAAPPHDIKAGPIVKLVPVKVVGASAESMYHSFVLARVGRGQKIDARMGLWPLTLWHILYSRDFWTLVAALAGIVLMRRALLRKGKSNISQRGDSAGHLASPCTYFCGSPSVPGM